MNAFICYITCIILLFAILSNYCYIIFICILITLTTYLMYQTYFWVDYMSFSQTLWWRQKKRSIGYTTVIVELIFFNPFGIQWKKILVNNYIKTITVTLLSGKQFSYFIFWNEYLWNDLVMIFNTLDILIISLTKYAEESIPDKIC